MISNRKLGNIFLFLFACCVITAAVIIADGYSISSASDVCFACHEDQDLFMDRAGKKVSLYVNPKIYSASVHSGSECTECHLNYDHNEIPHTKTPAQVDCKSCHGEAKGLDMSVHAKTKCADCHSKHDIRPAKEYSKDQTKSCLKCHSGKNIAQYSSSVHARSSTGCESCHKGGHNVRKIPKSDIASTCGKCHGKREKEFNNSIHQTVLKSGAKTAPTCSDCHGSHRILSSKMTIESEKCLYCHLDEKLFPGEQIGSAKFVAKYKTSVHASIEKNGVEAAGCADCHGDHNIQNPDNPMASTTRTRLPETCGKCHEDVVKKFLSSAHGKSLLSKSVAAPTCVSCHSEHAIESVLKSDEFSKINQVDMCLKCHLEGKLPHKNYKGEEVLISNYKDSYHYVALKNGKLNAATCSDCHGSHEMNKYDDSNSKIYKKNIASTCGASNCHPKQLGEYNGSIHEISLMTKDNSDAPTCTDCHGRHQILKKDENVNRLSSSRGLVQLCSDCHNSVEMVAKYNIPVGRTESYMESFHGLATRGGSNVAANCESCHSHHNVRPSTDSLSTISKKNLPHTCGKCHPGAEQTLLGSPIHIANEETDSPALYWITRFYIVMIFAVIGGMFIHNVFDFFKKFAKKNHKKRDEDNGR